MTCFVERLKRCRKNSKVTQKQVAEAIGTSEQNYQRYERGSQQPTLPVLAALADYFDVPLDYLTGRGIFENWEQIMKYKEVILKDLQLSFEGTPLNFAAMSEKDLIRILPALISKIDIDEQKNEINVVFYV